MQYPLHAFHNGREDDEDKLSRGGTLRERKRLKDAPQLYKMKS
jgi:hypothetical protein